VQADADGHRPSSSASSTQYRSAGTGQGKGFRELQQGPAEEFEVEAQQSEVTQYRSCKSQYLGRRSQKSERRREGEDYIIRIARCGCVSPGGYRSPIVIGRWSSVTQYAIPAVSCSPGADRGCRGWLESQ